MKDRWLGKVPLMDGLHPVPPKVCLVAAATNDCVPRACEVLSEVLQGALIARYREVAEVSFHDSPQPDG